jgi:hypothetical protein
MLWFRKKTPNKWQILANEIISDKTLKVDRKRAVSDVSSNKIYYWYEFKYNNNLYRILSDGYVAPAGVIVNSYKFQVHIDAFDGYHSCAECFKKETMRKIYNHVLGLYNNGLRNSRIEIAEAQIFGRESHEST